MICYQRNSSFNTITTPQTQWRPTSSDGTDRTRATKGTVISFLEVLQEPWRNESDYYKKKFTEAYQYEPDKFCLPRKTTQNLFIYLKSTMHSYFLLFCLLANLFLNLQLTSTTLWSSLLIQKTALFSYVPYRLSRTQFFFSYTCAIVSSYRRWMILFNCLQGKNSMYQYKCSNYYWEIPESLNHFNLHSYHRTVLVMALQ